MAIARTVHAQGVFVHDFVPALGELFGQKAFQDFNFQVDAVNEYAPSIAHWPIGAEDEAIRAESLPEKLQCGRIAFRIGDGLKLR